MNDKQDILDIELCHRHFQADYYLKDGKSHVENVKSIRMRCGHRLCPICETIKARQEYTRLTWKMNQIKDDYDFFFLTLTLPNVYTKFDNLIDIMNNCSDDMFKVIQGTDKNIIVVAVFILLGKLPTVKKGLPPAFTYNYSYS